MILKRTRSVIKRAKIATVGFLRKVPKLLKRTPPEEFFLRAGKQTEITPEITGFASRFEGKTIKSVREIMIELAKLKRLSGSAVDIAKFYAKRTASQILNDGFIVVETSNFQRTENRGIVEGCVDYNIALCAVLRAKNIPAKFVRFKNHALTHFFIDGEWFEADIMALLMKRARATNPAIVTTPPDPIRKIRRHRAKIFASAKAQGILAEGLDAADIGINSIVDFGKFTKHN